MGIKERYNHIIQRIIPYLYVILIIPLLVIIVQIYLDNNSDDSGISPFNGSSTFEYSVGFYVCGESFSRETIDNDVSDTLGITSPIMKIYYLVDYDGSGNTEFFTGQNYSRNYLNISEFMPYNSSELNLGSRDTLRNFAMFINDIKATYHVLIIWGHGKGEEGICFDGTSRLNSSDISYSLDGLDFDLLIFDACEMNSYGFLSGLSGSCDLILGSEKDIPDRGLDYSGGFTTFIRTSDHSPLNLAKEISENTISFYSRNPSIYSIQLSIIDMKEFHSFYDRYGIIRVNNTDSALQPFESGKRIDLGQYLETNDEKARFHDYMKCILDNRYLESNKGVKVRDTTGISIALT